METILFIGFGLFAAMLLLTVPYFEGHVRCPVPWRKIGSILSMISGSLGIVATGALCTYSVIAPGMGQYVVPLAAILFINSMVTLIGGYQYLR